MKKTLLVIFTCLGFVVCLSAQFSKAKGLPKDYELPQDFYFSATTPELNNYINNTNLVHSKDVPWRVINDRAGNKSYTKPDQNSPVKETLDYLETYYVVDFQGEWLRIIRLDGGGTSSLNFDKNALPVDMGWVMRSKMLLWKNGLLDRYSQIALKGILLNKISDIKNIISLQKKEVVDIFDGPYSQTKVDSRNIYNIFYVMKRENGRLLLSDQYAIGQDARNYIIGWVREERVSKWNTRIAIEPNFDEEAFNERKTNDDNHFIFFRNTADALGYIDRNPGASSKAIFDKDPVSLSKDKLSDANPRRYNGQVIRYPILENQANLFKTGVIGRITTMDKQGKESSMSVEELAQIKEDYNKVREEDKNVNVYFMIEGSTEMNPYKQTITDIVNNIPKLFPQANNINIGAAVYRDIDIKDKDIPPFENRKLSQNRKEILNFLTNSVFYRPDDADMYTVFRYALKRVLKEGNWEPKQRNLLIILGNGADIYKNTIRRAQEKATKGEYYIDGDELGLIYDMLADLDMNVLFYQVKNSEGNEYNKLRSDIQELMSETAKQIYNKNVQMSIGAKPVEPVIPDFKNNEFLEAKAAANYYGIYTSALNTNTPNDKFASMVNSGVKDFNSFKNSVMEYLDRMTTKGESFDVCPGEFQPAILNFMQKNLKGIDPGTLNEFLSKKYQLFEEAWLPKKVKGFKHELYSYVLFTPKRELQEFAISLSKLVNADNVGSMRDKREELKNAMSQLVLELSNQKSTASVGNLDMDEVLKIITGLNQEGVVVFKTLSKKNLKDITKESVFSDEEINILIKSMVKMKENIDNILKQNHRYKYCFRHEGDDENLYFWIALDEIMDKRLF